MSDNTKTPSGADPLDPETELAERFLKDLRNNHASSVQEFLRSNPGLTQDEQRLLRTIWKLDCAADRAVNIPVESEDLPTHIGIFEVVRQIGRGGMGVVYAVRDPGLDRVIALKTIRDSYLANCANPQKERQRFLNEARAAAALNHQNIFKVFSVGTACVGQEQQLPFFTMELIDGVSLDRVLRHLNSHQSPKHTELLTSVAMELCRQQPVEDIPDEAEQENDGTTVALSHAQIQTDAPPPVLEVHSNSANTIAAGLTPPAGSLEFARDVAMIGRHVADALDHAHEKNMVHRDIKPHNLMIDCHGDVIVVDFGLAIDDRQDAVAAADSAGTLRFMAPERFQQPAGPQSDVYALGMTINELLATSTKPQVPADLNAILAKATANDMAERYPTAAALRDELDLFLHDMPVAARPLSVPRRLARWCRRNPWAAIVCLLVLLTLIGVTERAFTSFERAETESLLRREKEQQAEIAEQQAVVALRESQEAQRQKVTAEEHQYVSQYRLAEMLKQSGQYALAVKALGNSPASQISWERRRLQFLLTRKPELLHTFTQGDWGFVAAAANDDTSRLVTADSSGAVVVWDPRDGRVLNQLKTGTYSADLRRNLHYYEPSLLRAQKKDSPSPSPFASADPDCVLDLAWLPGTNRVVLASSNGSGSVIDVDTKQVTQLLQVDEPLYAATVSADGQTVLFGGGEGRIFLRSASGKPLEDQLEVDSAVTDCLWTEFGWIVARADGHVDLLEPATLQVQATVRVQGPVLALDIGQIAGCMMIAVGCQHGAPRLFEPGHQQLQTVELQLEAGSRPGPPSVHCVKILEEAQEIVGFNEFGDMMAWDLNDGRCKWSAWHVANDRRVRAMFQDLTGYTPKFAPALPFIRRAAAIFPLSENRWLTAASNACLQIWRSNPVDLRTETELSPEFGAEPRLVFDTQDAARLWVLSQSGVLHAVNSRNDQVTAQLQAQPAGLAALTIRPTDGVILTAGQDATIRYWTIKQDQVVPAAGLPTIVHDTALLSVAISPDQTLVASVDVKGRLVVWDMPTGTQLFLTQLSAVTDRRPTWGQLAFSADGRMLAALGPRQSGNVFEYDVDSRSFHRLNDQIWIAGKGGGTAVVWNPVHPDVLVAADDYPRYVARSMRNQSSMPDTRLPRTGQTCRSLRCTTDGRRIVALEYDGRLRVIRASNNTQLAEFDTRLVGACDMAFDTTGNRLAVAASDGRVVVLETDVITPEVIVDVQRPGKDITDQCTLHPLVEPTGMTYRVDSRAVILDHQDRVHMLLIESRDHDFRDEGALVYVQQQSEKAKFSTILERLEPDNDVANRRITTPAAGLTIGPDDQPVVFYRRRTARLGPYDGTVLTASRTGANDWTFETVLDQSNAGFYPVIMHSGTGSGFDLLHFSFTGFYLQHSVRDAIDGTWKTEAIGRQGDGMYLSGVPTSDGKVHVAFRNNRFNSDPAPIHYARWDGQELTSTALLPVTQIQSDPAGTPAFVHWGDGEFGRCVRLVKDEFVEVRQLPASISQSQFQSRFRREFALATDDTLYLLEQITSRQLRLWVGSDTGWEHLDIHLPAEFLNSNFRVIRIDSHGAPVLVLGRMNDASGAFYVLRTDAYFASTPR